MHLQVTDQDEVAEEESGEDETEVRKIQTTFFVLFFCQNESRRIIPFNNKTIIKPNLKLNFNLNINLNLKSSFQMWSSYSRQKTLPNASRRHSYETAVISDKF